MSDQKKDLPEEQTPKNAFQQTKESWYDKLPVTLKQMDLIVGICWAALAVTAILIALEALDIFHLFG